MAQAVAASSSVQGSQPSLGPAGVGACAQRWGPRPVHAPPHPHPPLGPPPAAGPPPSPQTKVSDRPGAWGPLRVPPPTGPVRATRASSVCVTRRSSRPQHAAPTLRSSPAFCPAPAVGACARGVGSPSTAAPSPPRTPSLACSSRAATHPATCSPAAREALPAGGTQTPASARCPTAKRDPGGRTQVRGRGRRAERGGGWTCGGRAGFEGTRAHPGREEVAVVSPLGFSDLGEVTQTLRASFLS